MKTEENVKTHQPVSISNNAKNTKMSKIDVASLISSAELRNKQVKEAIHKAFQREAQIHSAQVNTAKLLEKILKQNEERYIEEKKGRKISLRIGISTMIIGIFIFIASIVNVIMNFLNH